MKAIICVTVFSLLLFACKKNEKAEVKENPCPTVAASLVPQIVQTAFTNRYAPDAAITWFRKDSLGYCAYFKQGGTVKKLAEFDNAGTFLREEADNNNDHNDDDSTGTAGHGTSAGCECEIPE